MVVVMMGIGFFKEGFLGTLLGTLLAIHTIHNVVLLVITPTTKPFAASAAATTSTKARKVRGESSFASLCLDDLLHLDFLALGAKTTLQALERRAGRVHLAFDGADVCLGVHQGLASSHELALQGNHGGCSLVKRYFQISLIFRGGSVDACHFRCKVRLLLSGRGRLKGLVLAQTTHNN
jgi:hypothetical protein